MPGSQRPLATRGRAIPIMRKNHVIPIAILLLKEGLFVLTTCVNFLSPQIEIRLFINVQLSSFASIIINKLILNYFIAYL